jgi:molybdate transport system substrate-binding protein
MHRFIALLIGLTLASVQPALAQADVSILAAASLKTALDAVVAATSRPGVPAPRLVYAGTPALVRMVETGAPGDLFLSADKEWMDHLEAGGHLRAGSRINLLTNRLAVIAPGGTAPAQATPQPAPQGLAATIDGSFPWRQNLAGSRLAVGLVETVPAGRYAKAALIHLGAWDAVRGQLAETDSVFGVLSLVGRGEAPLGIVYRTDALADSRVRAVGLFPEDSHPPIVYPMAILRNAATPAADEIASRLRSAEARTIFARAGFTVLE